MKPVIWIIDSQQWPRAYLRAELIERGFEAVGFIELAHALAALHHPYPAKSHLNEYIFFGSCKIYNLLKKSLTKEKV